MTVFEEGLGPLDITSFILGHHILAPVGKSKSSLNCWCFILNNLSVKFELIIAVAIPLNRV